MLKCQLQLFALPKDTLQDSHPVEECPSSPLLRANGITSQFRADIVPLRSKLLDDHRSKSDKNAQGLGCSRANLAAQ